MSILVMNLNGRNVVTDNVRDLVKSGTHILVFPRHLGCNLTLQLIDDIKALESKYDVNFPITYICQGSKKYCDHFWETKYPRASVIYDTNMSIAKSFGLKEGSVSQVLNTKAMFCAIKAMTNGNFPTAPQGNVFMLPGVFVYINGAQVFKHIAVSATDLPDFENLLKSYLLDAVA